MAGRSKAFYDEKLGHTYIIYRTPSIIYKTSYIYYRTSYIIYKTDGRHGFVIVTIRIDHLSVSRNLLLRLLFVTSSQSFLFQTVDEAFDVVLYPFIRLRLTIPRVLPEHLLNGGHGMLIGR